MNLARGSPRSARGIILAIATVLNADSLVPAMRSLAFVCVFVCALGMCALASRPVVAAVTFDWVGAGQDPCCAGEIVFSNEAFLAGEARFSTQSFVFPAQPYVPGDIVSFRFDAAQFGPAFITGFYEIDVSIGAGGLAGRIAAFGLESSILLAGTPDLWTVLFYRTDIPGRCHFPQDDCAGETGRWVQRSPGPVPEPDAAASLCFGAIVLAAAAGRRRKDISGGRRIAP